MKRLDNKTAKSSWAIVCYALILMIAFAAMFTSPTYAQYATASTGNTSGTVAHPFIGYYSFNNSDALYLNQNTMSYYQFYTSNKDGQFTQTAIDYVIEVTIPSAFEIEGLYRSTNEQSLYSLADAIKYTATATDDGEYKTYVFSDASKAAVDGATSNNKPAVATDFTMRYNVRTKEYRHYYSLEFLTPNLIESYTMNVKIIATQAD